MLLQRAFTHRGLVCQQLLKQCNGHVTCPIAFKVISDRSEAVNVQNKNLIVQFSRQFHVTNVNRDLEGGLKCLGAGIAATGVIGSGIGLGIIFGNLVMAIARNPSIANKVFTNAVMGAAFCESLGLFAIAIAFVVIA